MGLKFSVIEASRRDSFRNDCTDINHEINPDGVKYVPFSIKSAYRYLHGTSTMSIIERNCSTITRTILLFDNVREIKEIDQSIQVKNKKRNNAMKQI